MLVEPETELVALQIGSRQKFAETLFALWDRGRAVLPMDPALPSEAAGRILSQFRPARIVTDTGEEHLSDHVPVSGEIALVMPTSGTTGIPKGVELSHSAINSAALAGTKRLGAVDGDRWLCSLPFTHIAGLMPLVRSHLGGSHSVIPKVFDATAFDPHLDANVTSLVPTMLQRLLDANVDLSHFRAILLGGGPIPGNLVERAGNLGYRIVQTYGMTETCGGCAYDGRPLDGVEIKTDDEQRILIRGPLLMHGYRLDPEQTNDSLRDGWLHTNDRGRMAPDGTLTVTGRVDDIVVSGGENISLTEVQELLRKHPAIKDAAALGLPDKQWGQIVVAAIVPSGTRVPAIDELRDHVANLAARYKAPKRIVAVKELPRTEAGKIHRARLAQLFHYL